MGRMHEEEPRQSEQLKQWTLRKQGEEKLTFAGLVARAHDVFKNDHPIITAPLSEKSKQNIIARENLLAYLRNGETDPNLFDGQTFVRIERIKKLLLQAGHTALALELPDRGVTVLEDGSKAESIMVKFYTPNRYNLADGFYGIETLIEIVTKYPPDFPIESDLRQEIILSNLEKFEEIKEQLAQSGITWVSPELWKLGPNQKLHYWLETDQPSFKAGWYTLQDLREIKKTI